MKSQLKDSKNRTIIILNQTIIWLHRIDRQWAKYWVTTVHRLKRRTQRLWNAQAQMASNRSLSLFYLTSKIRLLTVTLSSFITWIEWHIMYSISTKWILHLDVGFCCLGGFFLSAVFISSDCWSKKAYMHVLFKQKDSIKSYFNKLNS